MKFLTFKVTTLSCCLLTIFVFFEVLNCSNGFLNENSYPILRSKRVPKKPKTSLANRESNKKPINALNKTKSTLTKNKFNALHIAGAAALVGSLGLIAGRKIENDQQQFQQQQLMNGGYGYSNCGVYCQGGQAFMPAPIFGF